MAKNTNQSGDTSLSSINGLGDLIKCQICCQTINNSKMLPCQHTFCSKCLEKSIKREKGDFSCPTCRTKFPQSSLTQLPKNVYVESLIKLFCDNANPQKICMNCGDVDDGKEYCDHCKQNFCEACWEEHLTTLKENFSTLMDHVRESEIQLEQQTSSYETTCEEIVGNLQVEVAKQISQLQLKERQCLESLTIIRQQQDSTRQALMLKIFNIKRDLENVSSQTQNAELFMHFHNKIVDIVNEISQNETALPIFDSTTFKVRLSQPTDAGSSASRTLPNSTKSLSAYYSAKVFCPKLIWTKCPRPAGLGIPPWNENVCYIATTDTKLVLIMNWKNLKVIGTLSSSEMVYPHSVTFCADSAEVYVSDKWKRCVHVFSSRGNYLRTLCSPEVKLRSPTGIAFYQNQLLICDAGSDAIVIVSPLDGKLISVFGLTGNRTELQSPTSVAVFRDRFVVADSGNHRIKVFGKTGEKLSEFGSMGKNRGQFKSLDVVACDSLGFILVGDSVNRRIQVFQPDGKLVRAFSTGKNCISGLLVTPQFEIVVTDCKARLLQIF